MNGERSSHVERRLAAAADATDHLVAGWEPSGKNVVRAGFGEHGTRRPVAYPLLSAAAVAAVVVAVVAVAADGSGDGIHTAGHASTTGSPSTSAPASSTRIPRPDSGAAAETAGLVLTTQLDGGQAAVKYHVSLTSSLNDPSGSYEIQAFYGAKVVRQGDPGSSAKGSVDLSVTRGAASEDRDPCVLQPGERAGRQGAPARDDSCTSVPRADGTRVWVHREGHSADRPWTTKDTKVATVSQLRADGTLVELTISNQVPEYLLGASAAPHWTTPAWAYPDDVLIGVVTSPQIVRGATCSKHCIPSRTSGTPGPGTASPSGTGTPPPGPSGSEIPTPRASTGGPTRPTPSGSAAPSRHR